MLAIVVINFLLIHAAPGDPASVIAGQSGAADPNSSSSSATSSASTSRSATALDLCAGRPHRRSRLLPPPAAPVAGLILERLPATLLLTGTAFVFAISAGITLGTAAARRVGNIADSVITVLALGFYATPIFWVGLMLVLVFSVWLNWLPSFGMNTVGAGLHGLAAILGRAPLSRSARRSRSACSTWRVYARLTRAAMLEVADQDFVRTARAKGVPEGRILRRHILRNALLPMITFAGIQAGQLIGGSILVETVFAWPGIGRLAFEALLARDYQLLLGVFLCTSVLVVLFNLLTDLLYAVVDPRVELA